MINQNILSMFKSHEKNPPFSILITDIEQEQECNQENIKFTVHQINKPISVLEENANVTSRKLNIKSELDIDDENLYKTKLVGYLSDEQKVSPISPTPDLFDYSIEMIDIKLEKEVKIEFNKEYKKLPRVIVNIDKQYESLYKKISTEYLTKEESDTIYTGVIISFDNLKTKKQYPLINITIIGEEENE